MWAFDKFCRKDFDRLIKINIEEELQKNIQNTIENLVDFKLIEHIEDKPKTNDIVFKKKDLFKPKSITFKGKSLDKFNVLNKEG